MKDSQSVVLKLFQSVLSFFKNNPDFLEDNLKSNNQYTQLKRFVEEINHQIDIKEKDITEHINFTIDKKYELSNTLYDLNSQLRSYAERIKNTALIKECDTSLSTLKEMSEVALDSYARNCLQNLKVHKVELADYGVTDDKIIDLQSKINIYSRLFLERRNIRQRKEDAAENIKSLITKTSCLIRNTIDIEMEKHKDKNLTLYQEYKKSRSAENSDNSDVSLKGSIVDNESEETLQYVLVTVKYKPNSDLLGGVKVSSKIGNFQFKNLPEGECTVSFETCDYVTASIETEIQLGRTTVLEMRMHKTMELQEI